MTEQTEKAAAAAERAEYTSALEQELHAAKINDPKRVPIIQAKLKRAASVIDRSETPAGSRRASGKARSQKPAANDETPAKPEPAPAPEPTVPKA